MAGFNEPIKLYTVDVDATLIETEAEPIYMTLKERR
jgi:hypothetical protein